MDPPTRTGQRTRVGGLRADEAIRIGPDPDFERFERSLQRSRRRRAAPPGRTGWRWRHAAPVGAALAAWWLLVAAPELDRDAPAPGGRGGSAAPGRASPAVGDTAIPVDDAVDEAWRYARERGGLVSLAVIDSGGRIRRFHGGREDDAADAIYARVGDAGLYEAARRAGMEGFSVAGYWGNAQVTAEDMARFMWRLDAVLAGAHREFGLGLLASVTSSQRWGIPEGAGPEWDVRFKGGWRSTETGQLVHQAAELRGEDGRLALAILTDAQPSQSYAVETLRGIADRLVGPLSR